MTAPVITIFVRHAEDCKYREDETWKRCDCRKHFRWFQDGVQQRRKAGTRSWAEAERLKRILEDQLAGRKPETEDATGMTIRAAVTEFLEAKKVKEISADALGKYNLELARFVSYCEGRGAYAVHTITLPLLTGYKATWPALYPSTYTRAYVQKRLLVFLHYCVHAGHLAHCPKLDPVKIDSPETQPLTDAEYKALLKAVPLEFQNGTACRVRAIIQLMRWSGLAIRDASCLKREWLQDARVWNERQKTKAHRATWAWVPIPKDVEAEILAAATGKEYLFWQSTDWTAEHFASRQSDYISRVFERAGVHCDGHMVSHRLRDTFAVRLLEKGVPMEAVSKLLGHKSIVITEKHYAKWSKGQQDRLDKLVTSTFGRAAR